MNTILGIYAHPDDESATVGGTLAKYAKAGWRVDIVIATRGDKGGDPDIRSKELEEAAGFLGVRSVSFLDYKDGNLSGMAPGEIEGELIKIIGQSKPDVVITHEPNGVTNHPDHIKMSYAVTFSFQEYAKKRAVENPTDSKLPKLYYSCVPESTMEYLIKQRYFPEELFDKPLRGVEDKHITTVINIARFRSAKRKALESHKSQRPILDKYLNVEHNPFFTQEYFVLRMIGVKEVFMGKNDRVSDRL